MQSAIWQTFWQSWGRFGTILRHNWGFSSYFLFGIAFVNKYSVGRKGWHEEDGRGEKFGVASKKAAGKRKAASE
ncbi:MAG: hypothetical protein IKC66_06170 [Alistipes sp.]|nr:hypothetical protein [Alistipes sp.]